MKTNQPSSILRSLCATAPALATLVLALASSAVLTLSGCASSAGIASKAASVETSTLGLGDKPAPALAADWWRELGDAPLTALVERALAGSPNLRLAQTRVERAQAAASSLQANEGLQVNGGADWTREHFSANSIYPAPLGGSVRTLANAQVGASWEFDFFGRNRAALNAALGSSRAAQAEVQAARNVLANQVARNYVQLGRLFEQRAIAERALKQRDEMLALVRQRVQSGLDTTVELRQGEGALPETRQQIEQLDEQITLTRHALAALTAQRPDALDTLVVSLRAMRLGRVDKTLPSTLPADLLGRRADISAARWRIEAASSDVQAARAAFYPNINLSAFVGLASIGLDKFVNAGSEQYGVGPAVRLPIFDSGRLRANLRGKAADLDAAIESYNATVLEAVHEVADPISSLRAIERQQREQAQTQAAAEQAFDLATQRFRAGLSTYLTVLNAESAVLAQRRLAADLQARVLDTQLVLIRSLGGGYNEAAISASTSAATTAASASADAANTPTTMTTTASISGARS
jgi:NodT family efflux transporter outer membrane factor (OMF) lipoprotein